MSIEEFSKRYEATFVLGVSCVGKGHFIENAIKECDVENRPVVLQHGKFFRNTLGPEFFLSQPNPQAPEITEPLVRNMVHECARIAHLSKKNLIVDGFPRTKEQVQWVINSSKLRDWNFQLVFLFLHCDADILLERMRKRRELEGSGSEALTMERHRVEVKTLVEIQEYISHLQAKCNYGSMVRMEHLDY